MLLQVLEIRLMITIDFMVLQENEYNDFDSLIFSMSFMC